MEAGAAWIDYYRRNPGIPLDYRDCADFLAVAVEGLGLAERSAEVCVDIGAGSGLRNRDILRRVARRIILVDVSEDSLASGEAGFPEAERRPGRVERLPLADGIADLVVASDLFMHIREWSEALAEVRRVMRPSALFVFNWLGTRDCQRPRAIRVPGGLILAPGVPIAFHDGAWARRRVTAAGFQIVSENRRRRLDPPHPEFFDRPHVHDEWFMVCTA